MSAGQPSVPTRSIMRFRTAPTRRHGPCNRALRASAAYPWDNDSRARSGPSYETPYSPSARPAASSICPSSRPRHGRPANSRMQGYRVCPPSSAYQGGRPSAPLRAARRAPSAPVDSTREPWSLMKAGPGGGHASALQAAQLTARWRGVGSLAFEICRAGDPSRCAAPCACPAFLKLQVFGVEGQGVGWPTTRRASRPTKPRCRSSRHRTPAPLSAQYSCAAIGAMPSVPGQKRGWPAVRRSSRRSDAAASKR
jgi:hypothetical protein